MTSPFWVAATALAFVCSAAMAQTPFRADAWRDHFGEAFMQIGRTSQPLANDPEATVTMPFVRGKCEANKTRMLRETSPTVRNFSIGFSGQCGGVGAAVVTIDKVLSETATRNIAIWSFPAGDAGIETFGPVHGVTKAAFMEKVNKALETAISLDPFPASRLPAWEHGQTIPKLPLGLAWRSGAERELYEAIRVQNHEIVCVYAYEMACAAIVPERGQHMVPVLSVRGLSDIYGATSVSAALAILTGTTSALNPAQFEAAKAREDAKAQRAFDGAMDIARRSQ